MEPENCLYIEDGGSDELRGASEVGMRPYQATWFLQSREYDIVSDFPRVRQPMEVLDLVKEERKSYE